MIVFFLVIHKLQHHPLFPPTIVMFLLRCCPSQHMPNLFLTNTNLSDLCATPPAYYWMLQRKSCILPMANFPPADKQRGTKTLHVSRQQIATTTTKWNARFCVSVLIRIDRCSYRKCLNSACNQQSAHDARDPISWLIAVQRFAA